MNIGIYTGSIVDPAIGAHAVVNASNPSVALGSGVSAALRQACGGNAFQQEVRERLEEEFDADLAADECLVTSAGSCTAFRWVLHVPAVDYRRPDPETGGPTGSRRVAACTRSALTEAVSLANENGLVGQFVLAAPLLGAGAGGLGAVASLDAMMGSVRKHLRESDSDQLRAIARLVFVVLQPGDARLVELAATKHSLVVAP
jgi:O-acetyl-ADP-ribose deacetylase (regulator of RNase III)